MLILQKGELQKKFRLG